MDYLLGQNTRDRLMRLLGNQGVVATLRAGGFRPGAAPWVLVRCTSATAVGGDAVRNQCYPAVLLDPACNELAPLKEPTDCLLTLLGTNGASVKPTAGRVYSALLTGDVEGDSKRRPRAFAAKGDGSGGGSSDTDCNGDGWLVAAEPDDYWVVQEIGSGNAPVATTQKLTINEVEYTVAFDPAVPSLSLTRDLPSAVAKVGRKDCSVCPCVTFAFKRKDFYPDFVEDPDDPCSRVLYVKVCASCPAGWYCTRPKNSEPGTPYTPLELEAGEACSGDLDVQSGGPWESEEEAEEHCSACPPNMGLPCCTSWALPWNMKAGDVAWHVYDRAASSSPPTVTNCLTIIGTGTVNVWYGPSKGCTGMTQFVFNSPRTCISVPHFDFLVNRIIYIEFTATVDGPETGGPTWSTGICNCFNEEQMCAEDIP